MEPFQEPISLQLQEEYTPTSSTHGMEPPPHEPTIVFCWAANYTSGAKILFNCSSGAVGTANDVIFLTIFCC